MMLECHILDTGCCLASEAHILSGGRRVQVACHSIAALLRHPRQGWLLWDTGYAMRMFAATDRLPYRLYRWATPLRLSPELAAVEQLKARGLAPADIRHVLISHFHADHIAGLLDFPAAALVASRAAWDDTRPRRGLNALRRAVLPALLPPDFAARARLVDAFDGPALPGLGPSHDLFGDRSLLLVPLPGHARGQLGLLAETDSGPVLFAADGCWHCRSIRERRPPAALTNLIAGEPAAVLPTIHRLADFAAARPETRIVPSHCPEAFERELGRPAGP